MVRASEKVWAKKIMPRACPSFQKAWLDRAELLKTPGSRAQIRAEPRLDPALHIGICPLMFQVSILILLISTPLNISC